MNTSSRIPSNSSFAGGSVEHAAPLATLAPGGKLGPYLIIAKLGGGDTGMIYKAQDNGLNRLVALKVLAPHLLRNLPFLQRVRREARAQARLNHPNVIAMHSMHETDDGPVLVMEYVEGQTLAQRIRNHGALPIDDALWIFEQTLHGVECAHAMDIVHRDLKPANIFITNDRCVKIMDFGLAKIQDRRHHGSTGAALGTLLYVSPEQVNGQEADARSDIYTLGISMYEAVTGHLPFQRNSEYALMHAKLRETPPNPNALNANIPATVSAVVLKAIEKDPARRFQSAHAFRLALLDGAAQAGIELPVADYDPVVPQADRRSWEHARGSLRLLISRLAARRLTLGVAFDLALLSAVIGLVLLLGLFPGADRTVQHGSQSVTPGADPAAGTNSTQSTKPAGTRPREDKYDGLRKAWGG
ncbi:MAG: serine/threonine protein kinase [Gammaproteobacteria bacterium]|nr:serine/threonine protein kinase [Gammaproteobacteria bacterium]